MTTKDEKREFDATNSQLDATATPEATTSNVPVIVTSKPVAATSEPTAATSEPAATTSEPLSVSLEPTVATTSEPVVATSDSAAAKADPVVAISESLAVTCEHLATTCESAATASEPVIAAATNDTTSKSYTEQRAMGRVNEAFEFNDVVKEVKRDSNVMVPSLGTLENEHEVMTGDPLFCQKFQTILAGMSELTASETKDPSTWKRKMEQDNEVTETIDKPRARNLLQIIRDGGWGLMIVLSAATIDALISSFGYGMSPLFLELRSQFKSTAEETSWVLSLQYISYVFAFIGTQLARAIGPRKTVMISGAVAAIGTFVSSFATNIYFLYLTLGLVTGVGFAGSLSTALVTNKKYFPKEKEYDLVNRLAMLAPGIAFFVFPQITQVCIDQYGWRGALLVESAVIANLCVCGALLRPLKSESTLVQSRETATNLPKSCDLKEHKQSFRGRFYALSTPIFLMYLISVLTLTLAVSGSTVHLQSRAFEAQVGTLQQTAFLVSISGICSIVGRVFSIFVGNWLKFSCIMTYILSVFVIGIACFIPQLADTYTGFVILSGLLGFGSGMSYSVFFSCASYLISPEKQANKKQLEAEVDRVDEPKADVGDSFAVVMFFTGIGLVIGAPIAGRVYDTTNNYDYAYFVFGAFSLFSGVILIPGYILTKIQKKKKGGGDIEIKHDGEETTIIMDEHITCT